MEALWQGMGMVFFMDALCVMFPAFILRQLSLFDNAILPHPLIHHTHTDACLCTYNNIHPSLQGMQENGMVSEHKMHISVL